MNIKRWIGTREENWQRLDSLLSKIELKRLRSLKSSEIRELASLYRSITADLARARTYNVSHTLVQSLQLLATRAYTQIYQGSRKQEWEAVIQFYRWGFPAVVQQTFPYIITATGLFILGMLVGWWYSWQDPRFMSLLIPESLISQVRDRGELWMGSIVGMEPLASSNIMINNISVSFSAVAGGITGGLFTIYILVFNGLLIGSIGTLVSENNLAYPFWAFVFPHGALELPAIFFAGAAGLLLGRGILFPGKYLRVEAIKYYSSLAAQLVFGIVPLLIIAGIIEGFFSPNPIIPDPVKYLVGLAIFILLVMYCKRG
ncbi:stage II sporulation protein M [Cylindrospermopsis raciborskii]|uniref:stage II sporulation protein M n=1 Tax=Cylindrospermopsis raciborskii TaxID=77022 RepID=UPI000778D1DA|nr:stage II sporulation protein M [Cylindrospermopsis raciborskii]MCZ2202508.1 stage II sporulation protein M [Cylindrospermopsis raciborskii PAMP2012]MCZ2206569.1 stage II sporulation protein M [Cylindrospermopsis raciborskii PAMP2011]